MLGPNDIAKSTRARLTPGRPALLSGFRRAFWPRGSMKFEIIDGIDNDFNDELGWCREAEQGRDLGMDVKMLIYPSQIGPVNEIFAPSETKSRSQGKFWPFSTRPKTPTKASCRSTAR